MDGIIITLLYAALMVAIVLLILFMRGKRRRMDQNADKKTAAILKRFAFTRNFRTLSGLHLQLDGKTYPVENMLIGYFGILLVKTLGAPGAYYGERNDKTWTLIQGQTEHTPGVRVTIPNPLLELQETTAALRTLLVKNKLNNIPVESLAYLTARSKDTIVYVKHGDEIQLPGNLARYLAREKFEVDTGLDIQKIADTIAAHDSKTAQ